MLNVLLSPLIFAGTIRCLEELLKDRLVSGANILFSPAGWTTIVSLYNCPTPQGANSVNLDRLIKVPAKAVEVPVAKCLNHSILCLLHLQSCPLPCFSTPPNF
ncbi:hypothetical protein CPAR01_00334 [Colletotrichum paranaense]|uniref:Uncharacterized protein n=1 Tax=Colletotrichum paranaense TaxID=1914294 RepID=A0ABQ9T4Y3_9PEZI|nr:uncharacterized protein CPAR01_00334 [Colletotrichum paranaense]KAK1546367.1 hypothetical protein CPAR01_00334 [Colletotrichum paranaense]